MTATWQLRLCWWLFLVCSRLKTFIVQLQMNVLKMEGEKLYFHHIMLYKFREEENIGTSTKKHWKCLFGSCSSSSDRTKSDLVDFVRLILTVAISHVSGYVPTTTKTPYLPSWWINQRFVREGLLSFVTRYSELPTPNCQFKKNGQFKKSKSCHILPRPRKSACCKNRLCRNLNTWNLKGSVKWKFIKCCGTHGKDRSQATKFSSEQSWRA